MKRIEEILATAEPGVHRWWTATTWRDARCLRCGCYYVDWYAASLTFGADADRCPPPG